MILTILFWLLLLLCLIGTFTPEGPYVLRGRWVVVLILVAILGFHVLGNPLSK